LKYYGRALLWAGATLGWEEGVGTKKGLEMLFKFVLEEFCDDEGIT
jgi:hypothetical protein